MRIRRYTYSPRRGVIGNVAVLEFLSVSTVIEAIRGVDKGQWLKMVERGAS
jgi:hypothetical protein